MGQVGKYMCFDVTSSTLLKKSEGVFVYIIQREMQSQNSVSVTNFLSSILSHNKGCSLVEKTNDQSK